jgi:ribosomal protein L37AE/L43A
VNGFHEILEVRQAPDRLPECCGFRMMKAIQQDAWRCYSCDFLLPSLAVIQSDKKLRFSRGTEVTP